MAVLFDILKIWRLMKHYVKPFLENWVFQENYLRRICKITATDKKKKVLLSISLSKPAHLFVWDEPLNYIDVISRIQIEEIIKESNPTLVLVEHDRRFVEDVANKIIYI